MPLPDREIQMFKFFDLNVPYRLSQHRIMLRRPCDLFVQMPMDRTFDRLGASQNSLTSHNR